MTSKKHCLVCMIVLLGFFSLAAQNDNQTKKDGSLGTKFFGFGKPKSKQEATKTKSTTSPAKPTKKDANEKQDDDRQPRDVVKIQNELNEIVSRSRQLQGQVRDDRNEIQEILERTQIHQRILKTITIPKTIQQHPNISNAENVIAREKMRLIAQQALQTQEQLKAIQATKALSAAKTESSQTS